MKSDKDIEGLEGPKDRDGYLSIVEGLLKKGKEEKALLILKYAYKELPNDPFILSYYGCLLAIVEKRASQGARLCRDAIEMVKRSKPLGEFIYPVLFLNLGRCYLSGGYKKRAIEAFKEGLKMDAGYPDIIIEMKRLGIRKRPPLPFLSRGNPLNKYIGLLLSRLKG